MPLFDFKCSNCGRVEELLVNKDSKLPKCKCKKGKWEKQFPNSFSKPIFNSKGFYQTDYVKKSGESG